MRVLAIVLLFCSSLELRAADDPLLPTLSAEQARTFARARLADAHALLLGPSQPTPPPVTNYDCHALYARRLELMRDGLDYRLPYWDDPRHVAAVFVGTLWTPAFYYLPYRAVAGTAADARRDRRTAELDQLRYASAAQRCFER